MNRIRKLALVGVAALSLAAGCKPDPAEMHREKGNEHANESRWKEAADEYGQSLQADPKQEKIWEQKAYAHMQLSEADPFEEAMMKLAEFKTDPLKKSEVYRNVGGFFVQKGLADKAEKQFLKAIQINPQDDQSLGWLAEIYAQRGGARANTLPAKPAELDKALEYLDKVVALKPTETAGYVNKRIALMKYLEYWQQEKTTAMTEATKLAKEKDPTKRNEFLAKADKAQAEFDQRKRMLDDVSQKLGEVAKAAQGAK